MGIPADHGEADARNGLHAEAFDHADMTVATTDQNNVAQYGLVRSLQGTGLSKNGVARARICRALGTVLRWDHAVFAHRRILRVASVTLTVNYLGQMSMQVQDPIENTRR